MKTLVRIDASVRTEASYSKKLADYFVDCWKQAHPNGKVIHRELSKEESPHLLNETVAAFQLAPEQLNPEQKAILAYSDSLIDELKQADELLISSPLYNLNLPSKLKSYLDHVIRAGHTFQMNESGVVQGLLQHISVYLICTKGGNYRGTPMEKMDFQEPYLKSICQFMGMQHKYSFSLEGTSNTGLVAENIKAIENEMKTSLK